MNSVVTKVRLLPDTPYIWRAKRPGARHRLICFPHGGGGAATFASWAAQLPPEIELAAVQLPGRQNRIYEKLPASADALIEAVTEALLPLLEGSVAFFGHSCGALLAFEVARALRAAGHPMPRRLFLSGQPSPQAFSARPKLHRLSHADFRAEIVELGGVDSEIVEDPRILDDLIPIVRADFEIWERHRVAPGPLLDIPVSVLCGNADVRAPIDTLDGWRAFTSAGFDTQLYPGGHFYFLSEGTGVLAHICRTLLAS
ncbi:thioesterase II family protein [Nocardia pseudobrasiliensis]|uniref:Thioesterase TesA n=1 Tax=Nocardia pseudobrasiliensis TaxID=45979 RepID=A0A370I2L3_9NOCA|nr:alpha/beta fold hydrolase [Nocardia pseudobrasiliensis]RDI64988.1 medium-chain acyl-[acyl-carrier-protein] hydrolase [Nocardia pseudobrasiliensis]